MVRIFLRQLALLVALLCWSVSALAKTTCNAETPQLCCDWWTVQVSVDGNETGKLLEDSFAAIVKRLEADRRCDASLCEYWRDHESCTRAYSAPRCASAEEGPVKQILDATMAQLDLQGRLRTISKFAEDEIANGQRAIRRAEPLFRIAKNKSRAGVSGRKLGDALKDYGKLLKDAVGRVQDLKSKLALQWQGGGYGFAGGDAPSPDDVASAIAALQTAIEAANRIPDFNTGAPANCGLGMVGRDGRCDCALGWGALPPNPDGGVVAKCVRVTSNSSLCTRSAGGPRVVLNCSCNVHFQSSAGSGSTTYRCTDAECGSDQLFYSSCDGSLMQLVQRVQSARVAAAEAEAEAERLAAVRSAEESVRRECSARCIDRKIRCVKGTWEPKNRCEDRCIDDRAGGRCFSKCERDHDRAVGLCEWNEETCERVCRSP